MMRGIGLVARHEFIETVRTKSFLFSLVFIPVMLAVGLLLPQWLERSTATTRNVTILDRSGAGLAAMIAREIERDWAIDSLSAVNSYVRAFAWPEFRDASGALDPEKVPPIFLKQARDLSDADADAFLDNGGLAWALAIATPFVKPGSPPPILGPKPVRIVPVPPALTEDLAGTDNPAQALRPWLKGTRQITPDGAPLKLHAVIVLPEAVAPVGPDSLEAIGRGDPARLVQIWSNGALPDSLDPLLERSIDRVFGELALLVAGGPEVRAHLEDRAPLAMLDIAAEGGRELTMADRVSRVLPRILSMMLVYFLYINMYMLMSNTMEEKSNRIIEVIVSSITPNELMIGKLLGSSLVALTMFAFSVSSFLLIFLFAGGSAMVEVASVLLDIIMDSPVVPALFVNFVLGYFLFAGIFLTLGAFCENNRDIQNLSTPAVLFMLAIPIVVWAIADEPNGESARILSFMPFFGPFMMMARSISEPPLIDVIGSVIVQILSIAFLLWLSGRMFRIAVLFSGTPKFSAVFRLLRSHQGKR
ncbi:MAG: ABC transporter permease [Rhodothalassiaceae bacterium]